MRVLILHSRYRSGELSGENRVVEEEAALLRDGGYEVATFTPTVSPGPAAALSAAADAVWSVAAASEVHRLVRSHRPDVVHVHNLFPLLSPAVLRAARAEGAPVVMTLHNFRLLCLPATFLRDGEVCEACLGQLPWRGVAHGCYRGSRAASLPYFVSLALHRRFGSFDAVDRFLAVSEFVQAKHVTAGLPAERLAVLPNFAHAARRREGPGGHFLFVGRLSPEKGLSVLLEAWRPELGRLVVVGDGPEAAILRGAPAGVEAVGAAPPDKVRRLLAGARALVCPSIWYEAFGRVIIEAYAQRVPVVASRIGALAEVVNDDETGLLFPPGDASALADCLERMLDDSESERLGEAAYRRWKEHYSPEVALAAREAVHRDVISVSAGGPRRTLRVV